MEYLWISLGGVAGANVRYALGRWIANRYGAGFPYGTFLINVTGAFAIGVILTLVTESFIADPRWRLLLVVGFLGSYTTFSSYTYETFALADRGDWTRAAVYVIGSNAAGLAACVAGVLFVRAFGTH